MKKDIDHMAIIWMFLLMQIGNIAFGQSVNPCSGKWTGSFMQDFKAIIQLNLDDEGNMTGNIVMFAGNNQIQDDELTQIHLDGYNLSFFIAAKETHYTGLFNPEMTELTGHFIFPDGSKHPLAVKKEDQTQASSPAPPTSYQSWNQKSYSQKALLQDLNLLIAKLKENHPRLYAYTSESKMEEIVFQAINKIQEEMTLTEFFSVIAPLTDAVKCSHTGMRLPSQYLALMDKNELFFPLNLIFVDDKAFYAPTPGEQSVGINPGTVIVSINGIPVKRIIKQLFVYIPAEGNNQTTKYNELNRHFSHYFQLISDSESNDIEYLHGEMQHVITLNGSRKEVLASSGIEDNPFDFHLDKSSQVGFLRYKSFNFPDINVYIQLTDSVFTTMQNGNVTDLVLDLRNNSGGHPIFAAQLLSYLTDHEFTYFKTNPDVPEFEPLYHPMQPSPLRFDGNLYILVNGGCLSTTGHLISLLKYHTNPKFIGEQPGSTYYCNDGSIGISLPNTGIEVNIPTTTFETAVNEFENDKPFQLDVEINQKIEDLVAGRDAAMEFLLDMIRQSN